MKEKIDIKEFFELEKKLEIRVGKILICEEVAKSDKLLKLTVDFGEERPRVVVTNIKPLISMPESLVGSQFPFVTNLIPAKLMGIESEAMILPGEAVDGMLHVSLCTTITNGVKIL